LRTLGQRSTAMERHPELANFRLNYAELGPSASLARSPDGQRLIEVIMSRDAVSAIRGAIDAAPSRPPQPALDRYLLPELELRAADDEMKKLGGRVVKQVVKHLGGQHEQKSVPITVQGICANGSTYSWSTTVRGRMLGAARRIWAEQWLAARAKRKGN
jgi:hypothetical protein